MSTQASRYPTKAIRLKIGGRWLDGQPVHGSYFEFREGAPFAFPLEVEVTSVFGEVLTDKIASLQVGSFFKLCVYDVMIGLHVHGLE